MTEPVSHPVKGRRASNRAWRIGRAALNCGLMVALAAPAVTLAQGTKDRARAIAGDPPAAVQRLVLADLLRPAGKRVALFDGHSLAGWEPWLGYADPALTYRSNSGAAPVGTGRDTATISP